MEKENGRITFFSKIEKKTLKNIREIPEGDTCSTISCVYGGAIIFFDVKKLSKNFRSRYQILWFTE